MLLDPANRSAWEAIWNSVFVSLVTVAVGASVGTFLAVVFTQLDFPLRRWLSKLAILPIALPPLVGVIAFLFVYGESGFVPKAIQSLLGLKSVPFFLEGRTAVVVVHVYSFYVYTYLFVSTALRQFDGSLLEAAASLGSDSWRAFRKVVYPAIRPALLGSSVLTFMASMASFSAPFLFGGQHRFITTLIYSTKQSAARRSLGKARDDWPDCTLARCGNVADPDHHRDFVCAGELMDMANPPNGVHA